MTPLGTVIMLLKSTTAMSGRRSCSASVHYTPVSASVMIAKGVTSEPVPEEVGMATK